MMEKVLAWFKVGIVTCLIFFIVLILANAIIGALGFRARWSENYTISQLRIISCAQALHTGKKNDFLILEQKDTLNRSYAAIKMSYFIRVLQANKITMSTLYKMTTMYDVGCAMCVIALRDRDRCV